VQKRYPVSPPKASLSQFQRSSGPLSPRAADRGHQRGIREAIPPTRTFFTLRQGHRLALTRSKNDLITRFYLDNASGTSSYRMSARKRRSARAPKKPTAGCRSALGDAIRDVNLLSATPQRNRRASQASMKHLDPTAYFQPQRLHQGRLKDLSFLSARRDRHLAAAPGAEHACGVQDSEPVKPRVRPAERAQACPHGAQSQGGPACLRRLWPRASPRPHRSAVKQWRNLLKRFMLLPPHSRDHRRLEYLEPNLE